MNQGQPNITELTLEVVRSSPQPLSFDEILEKILFSLPDLRKDPRRTVRHAIAQSRLVAVAVDATPRRYGWMPRLVSGSVLRHTLTESELTEGFLFYTEELRGALFPTFFEQRLRRDLSPLELLLPDGTLLELPLQHHHAASWGARLPGAFWRWLESQAAAPGDHLIFEILNGENKTCGIHFAPHRERDEQAIAWRNQEVLQAILAFLRGQRNNPPIWNTIHYLLSTGQYRHPLPPDSLAKIWTAEKFSSVLKGLPRGTKGPRGLLDLSFGLPVELEE